jgi:precorrin-2 C20-methyltransferase/precorrin-3B C17-methyltransferase
LWGVGLGPGDPELITLKALRIVQCAHVVAYPVAKHGRSNARAIVASVLNQNQIELPMVYPVTTEETDHLHGYEAALCEFYDQVAAEIANHLEAGRDVAILCEGDPFFYGSYMYLHDRLAARYITEVIPGIPSPMAASARLGKPLVRRDTETMILPGTLSEDQLTARLAEGAACVIMKVGRNFTKIRAALERSGSLGRALYIERATMQAERVVPVEDVDPASVPYFSLIIVPGPEKDRSLNNHPETGTVTVVGLGPGTSGWLTPETQEALQNATDLVGYQTYINRVPPRAGQRRHTSDNKVEIERSRHALSLAESGCRVCVVSSGDPGIFAMATAVMEALEQGPPSWRNLSVRVLPGVSAMQAAAARVGAPLGHDFCVISLSDRLKPWDIIAQRLEAAACADFALALYNPVSSERQWQLREARDTLLRHRAPETPVVVARDVGGAGEHIRITDLGALDPTIVDMRTLLLIGSSKTTIFQGAGSHLWVYTPRTYSASEQPAPVVADAAEK